MILKPHHRLLLVLFAKSLEKWQKLHIQEKENVVGRGLKKIFQCSEEENSKL